MRELARDKTFCNSCHSNKISTEEGVVTGFQGWIHCLIGELESNKERVSDSIGSAMYGDNQLIMRDLAS